MKKIIDFLIKNNIEYYEDFDIGKLSSIKIGSEIKIIIFPHTKNEFKKILKKFYLLKIYYRVFGNLSNVFIYENIDYPIIVTSKMQTEFSIENTTVTVSAGVSLNKFCDLMRKNCLSGIEGLCGIPASVGGAIYSNAGAFGYSISDKLLEVIVFFDGKFIKLKKSDIKFGYHNSSLFGFIVIEAIFLFENKKEYDIIKLLNEFTYRRNKSQPSGLSLGSIYKKVGNVSAGFYIERCGLKGKRIGGVVISNKHANFFINDNLGTVKDFFELLNLVENIVQKEFGVTLYTEIEKVGNKK